MFEVRVLFEDGNVETIQIHHDLQAAFEDALDLAEAFGAHPGESPRLAKAVDVVLGEQVQVLITVIRGGLLGPRDPEIHQPSAFL